MKKIILYVAVVLMSENVWAEEIQTSGICGATAEDCSWNYEDGKLTITGNGEMSDFSTTTEQPWKQWKKDITQIEMSGIKKLGVWAFNGLSHVTELNIPASIEYIHPAALYMGGLKHISFEENSNYKTIEQTVFANIPSLQVIELPDSAEYIAANAFWDTGLKQLVLPESLFKYGKLNANGVAFCHNLTIYCPKEHQTECEDYLKKASGLAMIDGQLQYPPLENITLQTYEKDGDAYFIGGKWYQKPNDVLTGKHIKKLRYTVEEAMKATEKGDKFHVFLTYK